MVRSNAADIVCIGAQRAMTSWLHHVFAAHPQTWVFPNFNPVTSTTKEAHYWDRNRRHGADWYRVLMRPLDDALKSLDFTPEYAFLESDAIADCKALNPTAKILYILRDPLARSISAVRMHTMWETGEAEEAAHAITYGPRFLTLCRRARLHEHSNYAANVARWREHYPDMMVLNYEDLAADPVGGARRLMAGCDLALDGLDTETRETLERRARRINWPTKKYTVDAQCVHFLHGLVARTREDTQRELGITFTEGDQILRDCA